MRAEQVHRLRVETLDWWGTQGGRTYLSSYIAQRSYDHVGRPGGPWDDLPDSAKDNIRAQSQVVLAVDQSLRTVRRQARSAEPFYVDADMTDLADTAARTMPTQPLRLDDAPAPSGFLVLDRPVHAPDVRGDRIGALAYSWSQVVMEDGRPAFGVAVYSDRDDREDSMWASRDIVRAAGVPRLVLLSLDVWPFGEDIGGSLRLAPGRNPLTGGPLYVPAAKAAHLDRVLLALWSLMQQTTLVESEAAHTPRAVARQNARAGLDEREVKVVALRRRYRPPVPRGEPGYVEWRSRWLVRGHWRRITPKNGGETRRVWVHAHVKGPDHLPLDVRPKVVAVHQ